MAIHLLVSRHHGSLVLRFHLAVGISALFSHGVAHRVRFLPETLRAIAGNGSVHMSGIHRPLVPLVGPRSKKPDAVVPKPRVRKSINPFPIFALPDVVIALVFTGVVYAVNYTVTATISSAFHVNYPWLSESAIGLSYLPTGLGMIVGSTFCGRMLDWDYARIKKKWTQEAASLDFPKEYARLRTMPAHLVLFILAVVGWGWTIEEKAHIAAPLVLQVISEYIKCVGPRSTRAC